VGNDKPNLTATDVLLDYNRYSFPQLRMILNAKTTLNPFSKIIIQRHDNLTDKERNRYEKLLREEIRKIPMGNHDRPKAIKQLLEAWDLSAAD
jgi:hypothetical protein